jgi:NAD(P)H dehydrogenase (quinone)
MILITGATGQFGKATIDFLLRSILANRIAALVRNAAKAEEIKNKGIHIRVGDYDNYPSLVEAFKGVDKLLLVSGNDIVNRGRQHESAVKAAKEAGVRHIIYTSFERVNETETSPIILVAKSHMDTEKYIKASGLTYTIMRNSLYADMLPMFMGEKVLETGIFLPAGDGRVSFTTRLDMAEAAAEILAGKGHENKEYVIANDVKYSLYDVAKILSEITGKQVAYLNPSAANYIDTLSKAGVPMEYVGMFASFSEAMKLGEFDTAKTDLTGLIHRKPTPLKDYLGTIYSKS